MPTCDCVGMRNHVVVPTSSHVIVHESSHSIVPRHTCVTIAMPSKESKFMTNSSPYPFIWILFSLCSLVLSFSPLCCIMFGYVQAHYHFLMPRRDCAKFPTGACAIEPGDALVETPSHTHAFQ